ncbi:hypothetical protein LINPERHAP1_LOCUS26661 [Linum perenne]
MWRFLQGFDYWTSYSCSSGRVKYA